MAAESPVKDYLTQRVVDSITLCTVIRLELFVLILYLLVFAGVFKGLGILAEF